MKNKIILLLLAFSTCFCAVFASDNLNIHSKTAVALDADNELVLYNKDMDKKIYPASTTKIITAIIAIENLDLNRSVVVSKSAINIPWDSSSVYLKEGEIISVNDLLYCLLLNSGNDAANVLAEAVSGDINKFVQLMNIKAKEIGCTNTNFNNAHGYSDDNHYTTALDMAKIFRYCIQNETFVNIISTKSYVVQPTNKTSSKRYLNNTNRLILQKEDSVHARYYEYCIGGKTGYTDEAGRTLVTFAKKENKTIIVAVFGASSSGSKDVRYTDAINLFEYSFNNFSKQTIAKATDYTFNYINIDKKLNYTLSLKDDLVALLHNDCSPDVSYTIDILDNNLSTVNIGNTTEAIAGNITFNINYESGEAYQIIEELYLTNIEKYKPITIKATLSNAMIILVTLLCFAILIIIIKSRHKNKNFCLKYKSRKHRRNNK